MRYILTGGARALACLAVFSLAALVADDAPGQEVSTSRVATGARVYGSMCGRCHNPRSPLERSDREWTVIANHMRIRGNLTGDQVKSVLAFLQATNTDPRQRSGPANEPAPGAPHDEAERLEGPITTDAGAISRGRSLVSEKACLGCHVIGDAGGKVGPTLNGITGRREPSFIRRKLADPTFNTSTSMMPNFGLTADEIEALLAYLSTLE
ncbi:MAG: c-type cytochrome [Gemmatimonadota bacterium]